MVSRLLTAPCLVALLTVTPAAALADDPPPAGTPAAAQPPAPATPTPATPTPATPTPATPAPAKPAPAAQPAPPKAHGSKGAAAKKNKKNKKADDAPVTGPVATYPGFRMLDGGSSRVFVTLSKKVAVTEHKAEGKLTYRIQGVRVPTRTNRLPLLTTFFATPVSRAELVERDGDVDLVIDVRNTSAPSFRIVENDKGAELQIDFPKVAGTTTTTDAADGSGTGAPASAGRPASTKSLDNKAETAY